MANSARSGEAKRDTTVHPPFYVFLTFVNAKGAEIVVPTRVKLTKKHEDLIEREDTLAMPEIVIPEHDEVAAKALRPLFDNVWNTFGFWGPSKLRRCRRMARSRPINA